MYIKPRSEIILSHGLYIAHHLYADDTHTYLSILSSPLSCVTYKPAVTNILKLSSAKTEFTIIYTSQIYHIVMPEIECEFILLSTAKAISHAALLASRLHYITFKRDRKVNPPKRVHFFG